MELNFKLECKETKECLYFTDLEIERVIRMSYYWNKAIYRKLKPFYEFQKNGSETSIKD